MIECVKYSERFIWCGPHQGKCITVESRLMELTLPVYTDLIDIDPEAPPTKYCFRKQDYKLTDIAIPGHLNCAVFVPIEMKDEDLPSLRWLDEWRRCSCCGEEIH